MTTRVEYLQRKRVEAWNLGIAHRETLLQRYVAMHGLHSRPFLKDVIDDLIEEVQGARLREEVLPLDTFGQTEVVAGRIEVSINRRISDMSGVKDGPGVAYVTKWHESFHIAQDMAVGSADSRRLQLALPGVEGQSPRRIVCSNMALTDPTTKEREFLAENAAVAAAIADADLRRCPAFVQFRQLAVVGGPLGVTGWQLLYRTAEDLGVNITALVGYFERQGLYRIDSHGGKRHLIANPRLSGRVEWV